MKEYNVYCDESCHLENDNINVMTLGAVWGAKDGLKEINREKTNYTDYYLTQVSMRS